MNKSDLVAIRNYLPEDKNFILSTFLRGLYYGNDFFHSLDKNIFMMHYHDVAETTVNSGVSVIKVACLKDDPEVILGYSISHPAPKDGAALDYVFVKSAWRKIGIAKSLLPKDMVAVTHVTNLGLSILKNKYPKVVFNPFIVIKE